MEEPDEMGTKLTRDKPDKFARDVTQLRAPTFSGFGPPPLWALYPLGSLPFGPPPFEPRLSGSPAGSWGAQCWVDKGQT